MNTFWYYPIHLAAFGAGICVLALLARRGTPWATRAGVCWIMCAVMAVFMFKISEPPDIFSDFYKAYYPAGKAVLSGDEATGLAATMRQGAGGFVNLPILAWLFAPFAMLPPEASGYVFFLLGVIAAIAAWYLLVRLAGLDRDQSLPLLFVFAASGPLFNSLREGNTTHFILLLLILGMWMMRLRRDFFAGLLFGFAAVIKLPLLLLGIYFVSRGRWRAGLGGAVVCAVVAIFSVAIFGWDLHVYWYEHSIKPFAETPLAAFNVQSVQGFCARLQHGDRYLVDWTPHALGPRLGLVSRVTAMLLMATVGLVIAWPRSWKLRSIFESPRPVIMEIEICIVILVAMMVSTVSWSHYYLWALIPAAYVIGGAPKVLGQRKFQIPAWVALIGALPPVLIVQTGNPLLGSIHGRFAVSHYLISAGLLIAVLLVADRRSKALESRHKEERGE